ncbi:putative SH3KBP1-binding protein 1 [Paratrimastix pyriformis]|uniref:SH3KBP1-binding protein 1 n=1 Tax=Paratrimastix pyriformis TaxID=342808 RepID=A0ABQ8V0I0_9EUKA|nr:putative SH3KBP1-binding protein 1 [Paratrimastix pyriformis]
MSLAFKYHDYDPSASSPGGSRVRPKMNGPFQFIGIPVADFESLFEGSVLRVDQEFVKFQRMIENERIRMAQEQAEQDEEKRQVLRDFEHRQKVARDAFAAARETYEKAKQRAEVLYTPEDPIIELNVGGKKFHTLRATIMRCPNSLLADMIQGKCGGVRDPNGRLFVDRNPDVFELLLDFIRTEQLPPFPSDADRQCFRREAEFFRVPLPELPLCMPSPAARIFPGGSHSPLRGSQSPTPNGGRFSPVDRPGSPSSDRSPSPSASPRLPPLGRPPSAAGMTRPPSSHPRPPSSPLPGFLARPRSALSAADDSPGTRRTNPSTPG